MDPFDFSRCISLLKMGLFQPAILVYQRFFAAFLQFGEFFSTSKIGQRLEQTSMFRREMFWHKSHDFGKGIIFLTMVVFFEGKPPGSSNFFFRQKPSEL